MTATPSEIARHRRVTPEMIAKAWQVFKRGRPPGLMGRLGVGNAFKEALHAALSVEPALGQQYTHLKRGSTYEVIGEAGVQASTGPINEGDRVVVYVADDGTMHVRKFQEFHDGRFRAGGEPSEQ